MNSLIITGNATLTMAEEKEYYNNDVWILGVSLGNPLISRYDVVFELHWDHIWDECQLTDRLINCNKPIYLRKHSKLIKDPQIYPFKEIFKKYGKYFASSITLMMALAFEQGYEKIYIYGIDYNTNRELYQELKNLEYWIGYLRGKGIEIILHPDIDLCKDEYIYSYDDPAIQKALSKIDKRIERLHKFNALIWENIDKIMMLRNKGRISAEEYFKNDEMYRGKIRQNNEMLSELELLRRTI